MTLPEQSAYGKRNVLLPQLAAQAATAYPAEAKRITCALRMIEEDRVYLGHEGTCFVESQSQPGLYYRLEGRVCYCAATVERCAHRWARALMRRLAAELDIPTTPTTPTRYYAQILGRETEGEAEEVSGGWWAFYLPGGEVLTTLFRLEELVLLGEVASVKAQRILDGDYARKVCGL
jgi:hypothetical protein